jgi:hypothetical protein
MTATATATSTAVSGSGTAMAVARLGSLAEQVEEHTIKSGEVDGV